VYTAATKSLAALGQLVHLVPPRALDGYVIASISVQKRQIGRIRPGRVPSGWDRPVAIMATRLIGDEWVLSGRTLALAVPSVVMPGEFNYLINPTHPDFASAVFSPPEPFSHDPRLA
jgi:RES domain-containing protein